MDFNHAQEYWNSQAVLEAKKNCGVGYQNVRSPCNVFILDTSSSVGKDGFAQMKEMFSIIIDEYATQDIKENVAVIVCGRQTKFLRHYSSHYEDIKHSLDEVEFGGSSPLTAAFFLSLACVKYGGDRIHRIGAFCVHPRIIFISDGRPTSFTNLASAFVEDSPLDETENDTDHLLQLTRSIGKISPIFCIPVGRNPNMTTLEFISGQSRGGKIVCAPEARQFAKYSLNIRTASMLSFTMENDCNDNERILTSLACKFPDKIFTEMDQKDIIDICLRKYLYQSVSSMEDEIEDKTESPHEEKYPQMPRLGSRVRRGRDWRYDDHDNYGPGTVVSHLKEGTLLVEWDNGIKSDYRFGTKSKCNNKYDVQLCSEPRILVNELIATGCLVTRGKDWIWGSQDGGAGNIGSVISVHSSGVVFVRWQHGLISNYKFGADGCFDLEISDPFSPEAIKFLQDHVKKTPFDSRDEAQVDVDENNNCTDGNSSSTINSLSEKNSESVKTSSFDSVNRPILHVTKGKYFKNNSVVENTTPDIETDGPTFTCAMNQWWWKDCEGKWNPYSREVNERINKCYKRDPKSTVIVAIKDQSYRVVMAKNQQINQTTRDISEIKLVTNWSCP